MEDTKSVMIDDYILTRELGSGANARVYLGHHKSNEKEFYAVKLINTDSSNSDEVNAEAIQMEAKTLQNLNHPNIIRVYDLKTNGRINNKGNVYDVDTLYCVMQLAQKGVMLDYLMTGGQMTENVARYYFKQLVEAMNYIHSKDVVHRDLKPDNLLLGDNYQLLVADFGHCAQNNGSKDVSKLSTKLGTPIYNAPEVSSSKTVNYNGKEVDSFMAGVVLFILLTANTPFRDGANKIDPFYKNFINGNPDAFWALHESRLKNVKFSGEFKSLLNALFAVEGDKRPSLNSVLQSSWMQGPTASDSEAKQEMQRRYEIQEQQKAAEAEKARARKARAAQRGGGSKAYGQHQRDVYIESNGIIEHLNDATEEATKKINEIVFKEAVPEYRNDGSSFFNCYYSAMSAEELLKAATVIANNMTDLADVHINVEYYEVIYHLFRPSPRFRLNQTLLRSQ